MGPFPLLDPQWLTSRCPVPRTFLFDNCLVCAEFWRPRVQRRPLFQTTQVSRVSSTPTTILAVDNHAGCLSVPFFCRIPPPRAFTHSTAPLPRTMVSQYFFAHKKYTFFFSPPLIYCGVRPIFPLGFGRSLSCSFSDVVAHTKALAWGGLPFICWMSLFFLVRSPLLQQTSGRFPPPTSAYTRLLTFAPVCPPPHQTLFLFLTCCFHSPPLKFPFPLAFHGPLF